MKIRSYCLAIHWLTRRFRLRQQLLLWQLPLLLRNHLR